MVLFLKNDFPPYFWGFSAKNQKKNGKSENMMKTQSILEKNAFILLKGITTKLNGAKNPGGSWVSCWYSFHCIQTERTIIPTTQILRIGFSGCFWNNSLVHFVPLRPRGCYPHCAEVQKAFRNWAERLAFTLKFFARGFSLLSIWVCLV